MFCVYCNHSKPAGAFFCGQCGKKLINLEALTQKLSKIGNSNKTAENHENIKIPILIPQNHNSQSNLYPILKNPTKIGRKSDSDLFLEDPTVSRKQGEIFQKNNKWFIEDRGSLNGTYVNQILENSHELQDNDVIQIGKYVFLYKLIQTNPET